MAGAKQRALLTLLALEASTPVRADRLIDALWPGDQPADAANALQHQISRLRRVVGDDVIIRSAGGYTLQVPPDDIDALRFARLAREGRAALRGGDLHAAAAALTSGLALRRDDPLVELADDDWARVEAARLDALYLDVLEDCFDVKLALGDHGGAIAELRAAVSSHPFRERLWRQLMTALYRCGRQTEALAAYQDARRALGEAHGVEPGLELQSLEAAILQHDPVLTAPTTAAPPAPVPTSNVPIPLTSFIGRHEQLSNLRATITDARLVTLTGPGGSGKTRMAIEAAHLVQDDFVDGAWFVELAPLVDAAEVAPAVAAVLSVDGTRPLPERISEHLRAAELLLVLDNAEHLLPGLATWVDGLLGSAPRLRVLVTSREPLGINGEVQWAVPPLSLPHGDESDPRELAGSEAVRLFEDRAKRVGPFVLDARTAPVVADLCRHLDGLPLAIELAAARTKAFPVEHIAAALDQRFRLLVGPRTAPARQRTLQATLDWSFDLLDEMERTVLAVVSVFDGGCALAAAQHVGGELGVDPIALTDALAGLVDKSLVLPVPSSDGSARYDVLETIRAYGRDRAAERGHLDALRAAHRAFFLGIAEEAGAGLGTGAYRTWHVRVREEYANIRAAFDGAVAAGDADAAMRIVAALWQFWASNDRHAEGRTWVDAALSVEPVPGDETTRTRALTVLCYLAGQQLDLERAVEAGEEAVARSTRADDEWGIAWAKLALALALQISGDAERSAALLDEARPVMASFGDDYRLAGADLITCVTALEAGDLDRVERTAHDVRTRVERIGFEPFRCWALLLLSEVAERRGDLESAAVHADAAVASATTLQLRHFVSYTLTRSGRVAALAGRLDEAETAQRAAIAVADEARAAWFGALARVALADTLRRRGEHGDADALFREVVSGGRTTPAYGREAFFEALAGDPLAIAEAALG